MKKIGINALYIKWGVNAGTETYFTNIVKPWYKKHINDIVFILYCNDYPPWWDGEKKYFKIKIYKKTKKIKYRFFTEQFLFPLTLGGENDVMFNPGYVGSVFLNTPQVTTIHDGFAWVYPKEISLFRSIYWKIFIPLTAKKATKIIAVSKNTAIDIENFCEISQDKIEVIYESGGYFDTNISSGILKRYNIKSKEYFHCVGFFKDIKNPIRILEAFKRYKLNNKNSKVKLLLVGYIGGDRANEILNVANTIRDVIYLGRVSDEEVVELYKNSLGLIFPSLYEGFGIPILESQSLDCPVVTSNISAMPEIAGNGAIIVNPLSVNDIVKAYDVLENNDNSRLIELGRENIKKFSWEIASSKTLEILKSVGENK